MPLSKPEAATRRGAFMNLSLVSMFMIGLLGAALIFLLYQIVCALRTTSRGGPATIPPDVTVKPRTLLTRSEAGFYNMIRLAVEDDYLVFPHVPFTGLLHLAGGDDHLRASLMPLLHTLRVDFVLVHPGTLQAAQIIEFEDEVDQGRETTPGRERRTGLIEELCKRAGIPLVRVKAGEVDTVPKLAALLGMGEPEP